MIDYEKTNHQCPVCGLDVEDNTYICDNCGVLLKHTCPSCGQIYTKEIDLCSDCGINIEFHNKDTESTEKKVMEETKTISMRIPLHFNTSIQIAKAIEILYTLNPNELQNSLQFKQLNLLRNKVSEFRDIAITKKKENTFLKTGFGQKGNDEDIEIHNKEELEIRRLETVKLKVNSRISDAKNVKDASEVQMGLFDGNETHDTEHNQNKKRNDEEINFLYQKSKMLEGVSEAPITSLYLEKTKTVSPTIDHTPIIKQANTRQNNVSDQPKAVARLEADFIYLLKEERHLKGVHLDTQQVIHSLLPTSDSNKQIQNKKNGIAAKDEISLDKQGPYTVDSTRSNDVSNTLDYDVTYSKKELKLIRKKEKKEQKKVLKAKKVELKNNIKPGVKSRREKRAEKKAAKFDAELQTIDNEIIQNSDDSTRKKNEKRKLKILKKYKLIEGVNDPGYDSYYEDVVPIDINENKSIHRFFTSENKGTLLVVTGMLLLAIGIFTFTFMFL